MCNRYPRFIRACYRTGQAGRRVSYDDARCRPDGHLDLGSRPARSRRPKPTGPTTIHFRPLYGDALDEVIAELKRRFDPTRVWTTTTTGIVVHVTTPDPPDQLIRRMTTFGWRVVDMDGHDLSGNT